MNDKRDIDRLEFPRDIADTIGLSTGQIAFLKKKGCLFYGRKTTIRWVRKFIREQAQTALATSTRHQEAPDEAF